MRQQDVHTPVLLAEVIAALAIKPNGIYIDATFGRGGHSQAILAQLSPQGQLHAFDKDPTAVAFAREHFSQESRLHIQAGSFTQLASYCQEQRLTGQINGILLDLGVSSPQLEEAARGFSFLQDGPLDMRMDNHKGESATEWLAKVKEVELAEVLHRYGEERFARRIAKAIIRARAVEPIITTGQLASIVSAAHPAWEKNKHPATRVFQALRIMVNQELVELDRVLNQAIDLLAKGGRLAIISFHSLEDRMVKQFMRKHSRLDLGPPGLPLRATEINTQRPALQILGKSIKPSTQEIAVNPRSRSATLRVAEKIV